MARLRTTAKAHSTAAPKLNADHPHLRYPDEQPLFMDRLVLGLPQEARALLFVIFFLACLMLAFSLINLMLRPGPRQAQPAAPIETQLRQSDYAVPRT